MYITLGSFIFFRMFSVSGNLRLSINIIFLGYKILSVGKEILTDTLFYFVQKKPVNSFFI